MDGSTGEIERGRERTAQERGDAGRRIPDAEEVVLPRDPQANECAADGENRPERCEECPRTGCCGVEATRENS